MKSVGFIGLGKMGAPMAANLAAAQAIGTTRVNVLVCPILGPCGGQGGGQYIAPDAYVSQLRPEAPRSQKAVGGVVHVPIIAPNVSPVKRPVHART